ncbi:CDP-alcohol phosphatidyltransferase family protein [Halovibrio sp. HP20-50]|uniref:CDP-alcohol phosphatidyltransferase family protein n=1 Tax=Halovibrio sp. HP20-59 TaxID=3080275 RepID=UPI00294ABFF3|nr:CDP-alcohol phosphatidyltransferase family protein [Halovibrio sp. HP20-59]MEA2118049.1 CDP-alcohol phosphatidyltransferase family protein [Halovibrio sp. HP20-59]
MFRFLNTSGCYSLSKRFQTAMELVLGGLLLLIAGQLLPNLMAEPINWTVALGLYIVIASLVVIYWPQGALGWANRVTLVRAVLVALVAGGLAAGAFEPVIWQWLLIAVLALLLDGVDGWVARRTQSHSAFGARFDMELDALLIMLLCVGLLLESMGPWVLLIGGMRYLFVIAGCWFTWLKAPLPLSLRRKIVCVWQVSALLLALTPLTSHVLTGLLAISALLSLVMSFGADVKWLYQQT